MEITKSQKRLFIILGIVLLYAVIDFINNKDTYLGFYGDQSTAKAVVATQKNTNQNSAPQEKASEYLAGWGKDPFYISPINKIRKRIKKQLTKPRLQLFAISYKGEQSAALINDKILHIGDLIAGYHVKNIKKNLVLLSDGKKTLELKLPTY